MNELCITAEHSPSAGRHTSYALPLPTISIGTSLGLFSHDATARNAAAADSAFTQRIDLLIRILLFDDL
jgi:hypothetical protein